MEMKSEPFGHRAQQSKRRKTTRSNLRVRAVWSFFSDEYPVNLANSEDYGQATQMLSFSHMLQTGGVAGWSLHAQIVTWARGYKTAVMLIYEQEKVEMAVSKVY